MPAAESVCADAGRPVAIEPVKNLADAARGERNAGIGRAVIEVDPVVVRVKRIATWKCDVADIAFALVVRFGSEDPGIATQETVLRGVEIKESRAQSIETSRARPPDSVIQHQPAARRFDERRRQSDLVGIPPRASTRAQHQFVVSPIPQIR